MSKYDELNQQFEKYLHAQQTYTDQVASVASDLAEGFGRYLGLGRRDNSVRLGSGTGDDFVEANWTALPKESRVVRFSLSVKLKAGSHSQIEFFEISVSASEGFYKFIVERSPEEILISELDVSEKRFSPVYDRLSNMLMKVYDPKQYGL